MNKPVVVAWLVFAVTACAPGAPTTAAPEATVAPAKAGALRYAEVSTFDLGDAPVLLALDDLQAQGYTVEVGSIGQSDLLADTLARGDIDIASANNQTLWAAAAEGADIRSFMQKDGSTLIVIAAKEVAQCSDLDGKTFGVAVTTGLNPKLFEEYLARNCPGAEPQVVIVSGRPERMAAMIAGELDAALMFLQDFKEMDDQAPGRFHVLVRLYEEFAAVQTNGLHTRRAWAEQNPEMLKDFIRAVLMENRRVMADPELLVAVGTGRLEMDPAEARDAADLYLEGGVWDANGGMTRDNIQYTLDFLIALEALPADLTVDDVADLSYLEAVLAEIGRQ